MAGFVLNLRWTILLNGAIFPTVMKSVKRAGGFTLVELMVVVVITLVLASMVFMFSARAINRAEKVKAVQQMRDLAMGM